MQHSRTPVIIKKTVKIFQSFSSKLMEEYPAPYLSPRHGGKDRQLHPAGDQPGPEHSAHRIYMRIRQVIAAHRQ